MADDVKLQLGIDVEALQRSASQATNALTQAFEKGISSSLLGNGMMPTQGPAAAQDSKGTIRGVIDALERVNRTLVVGFNSLAGGVYTGGGGGGAGGSGGGAGPGPAGGLAPPTPGTGVAGGGVGIASQILSRAGDLASALMPSSMRMFMGAGLFSGGMGFQASDVMGFVHNLVSQIPVAGKLLGAVTSPFHQVMQQNNEFRNMQYELFRDAGAGAMDSFTNLWEDDDYRDQFVNRYGFSRGETQQLVQAGARRGIGQGSGMETVLHMQGQLGLGTEGAETLGGLRRAGLAQGQEGEAMASAIGVAVATGLERGRWGEMLTMWQRAAQSSVDTDVAWKEVASQQQFVGSLGRRFQGDTPAAQSMTAALQQMASNQQSPLALMSAMQLTGGDYFGATARMSRAAEQPDLALQEAIIDRMMGTAGVRAWLAMPDGPDADRALDRVAGVAATLGTGLSQLKIATLLKAKKAAGGRALFGPLAPGAVDVGRQQVTGGAALPATALDPRRHEAEAQRPSGLTAIQGAGSLGEGPGAQFRRSQDASVWRGMGSPPAAFGAAGGAGFSSMQDVTPGARGSGAAGSGSYRPFVMQEFGHPIPGRAPHPGVDLAFPPGTAVTCPVDGIITEIHRNGTGVQVGTGIHIRDASGQVHKIYHIDPATFPASLQVGQRITRGTPLGRTYSNTYWQSPSGPVRTHLHYGQISPTGAGVDPMRPGGVEPGALTGGTVPAFTPAAGGGAGGTNVTVDVHLHHHQDPAGRPVTRVRTGAPVVTSSPGQLVGGSR